MYMERNDRAAKFCSEMVLFSSAPLNFYILIYVISASHLQVLKFQFEVTREVFIEWRFHFWGDKTGENGTRCIINHTIEVWFKIWSSTTVFPCSSWLCLRNIFPGFIGLGILSFLESIKWPILQMALEKGPPETNGASVVSLHSFMNTEPLEEKYSLAFAWGNTKFTLMQLLLLFTIQLCDFHFYIYIADVAVSVFCPSRHSAVKFSNIMPWDVYSNGYNNSWPD